MPGGVHASMVGSLHPYPIAVTPLLAPHSAAVAFCEGVLSLTTDWDVLARDTTLSKAFTSRVNLQPTAGFASSAPSVNPTVSAASNRPESPTGQVPIVSHFANSVSVDAVDSDIGLPARHSGVEALSQTSERVSSNHGSGSRAPEPSSEGLNLENELANEEAASVAVAAVAAGYDLEETRARLREVLSLTDVTRFPCPEKAEAVILVAATVSLIHCKHTADQVRFEKLVQGKFQITLCKSCPFAIRRKRLRAVSEAKTGKDWKSFGRIPVEGVSRAAYAVVNSWRQKVCPNRELRLN